MKIFWKTVNSPIIVTLIFGVYFYFFFYYPLHPGWHIKTTRTGATSVHAGNYSAYYSYLNGTRYKSAVPVSELDRTPTVASKLDKIPIAPGEALASAEHMLSKFVSDPSTFKVESVSLEPQDKEQHYAYIVRFVPPDLANTNVFSIVVLMDGTVIKPTISKGDD